MSDHDDFELWLGRIGKSGSGDRFASGVIRAARLAGGVARTTRKSTFHGSRIGRGSGVGRLLASRGPTSDRSVRRVVVKTSIVKLGTKGVARAAAHMRYLARDGTTRDGQRGALYSAELDIADGKGFAERGTNDRHQFRLIVSPEDGSLYDDMKPLVRQLMDRMSEDLGTRLDWVAVDHFNTGHPHSHILLRGKDDKGKDLIIARDYLTSGIRERAGELVNLHLGPRSEREIELSRAREIDQERFTRLDRSLLASRDADQLVDPRHVDPAEHDRRLARLRRLARMDLAEQMGSGRWRVHDELEPILRRMGMRGDIIREMNRALRETLPERAPQDQAIYEPMKGHGRLVGRLITAGLSDEHADRRYLLLDATDGRTWHVEVGGLDIDATPGAILSVEPAWVGVREVDRTVAAIAEANGGRYTAELHKTYDPSASQAYVQAHVRRLEAMRRATGSPARHADGSWTVAPDHLDRVAAYEHDRAARAPVHAELLSRNPLDRLVAQDGPTVLDRMIAGDENVPLERGFGVELRQALEQRRQWLAARRLLQVDGRARHDLVATLERSDLDRTTERLSRELGKPHVAPQAGLHVTGICRGKVEAGTSSYAIIERSQEFSLVPWRPVLERRIGQYVEGLVRGSSISWTFGRERGGPSL